MVILRVTDRMNTPAPMEYRDLKMNVLMVDYGVICELQLHMDGFYKKKEELHKHYEIERAKKLKAVEGKRTSTPDIIGLSDKEMESLSADMVMAQQEVDTAKRVRTEFAAMANMDLRKGSLAALLRMQTATREAQAVALNEHAAEMTCDPAADSGAAAAAAAIAAAQFAIREACHRSDLAVGLAARLVGYSASMVACRAAAAAAAAAQSRVHLLAQYMWLEAERDLEEECYENVSTQKVRLNRDRKDELAKLRVRAQMGVLWKAGMAGEFVGAFTKITDEQARVRIKYVVWPLAATCFGMWRAWLFARKLTGGRAPPKVSKTERFLRQQRRVQAVVEEADSDSSDDEEERSDVAFWAEVKEEDLRIRPNRAEGAQEYCCSVLRELSGQQQRAMLLVQQYVAAMAIKGGVVGEQTSPGWLRSRLLQDSAEESPSPLSCGLAGCREDKQERLISRVDAECSRGRPLGFQLTALFGILGNPCSCQQARCEREKAEKSESSMSAAARRHHTRMSMDARLSDLTISPRNHSIRHGARKAGEKSPLPAVPVDGLEEESTSLLPPVSAQPTSPLPGLACAEFIEKKNTGRRMSSATVHKYHYDKLI
jgi:hypothetical protein